jgi:hypothetical protein
MRLLLVVAVCCASSLLAAAGDPLTRSETAPPENARYQLVQNPQMARFLFRLDRITGRVSRYGLGKDDRPVWGEMVIFNLPKVNPAAAKPRFQIFISGILTRQTILLDTTTGKTWELVSFGDPDVQAWQEIKEADEWSSTCDLSPLVDPVTCKPTNFNLPKGYKLDPPPAGTPDHR